MAYILLKFGRPYGGITTIKYRVSCPECELDENGNSSIMMQCRLSSYSLDISSREDNHGLGATPRASQRNFHQDILTRQQLLETGYILFSVHGVA